MAKMMLKDMRYSRLCESYQGVDRQQVRVVRSKELGG